MKSFTKDNHTEMTSFITLKFVCHCYLRMLIPYNPTENFKFSVTHILRSGNLQRYSGFQCDVSSYPRSDDTCILNVCIVLH